MNFDYYNVKEFQARVTRNFSGQGSLINISSATYKRKAPQGKMSVIFFLDTLKAAF